MRIRWNLGEPVPMSIMRLPFPSEKLQFRLSPIEMSDAYEETENLFYMNTLSQLPRPLRLIASNSGVERIDHVALDTIFSLESL